MICSSQDYDRLDVRPDIDSIDINSSHIDCSSAGVKVNQRRDEASARNHDRIKLERGMNMRNYNTLKKRKVSEFGGS